MKYKNDILQLYAKLLFLVFLSYNCLAITDEIATEPVPPPQQNTENESHLVKMVNYSYLGLRELVFIIDEMGEYFYTGIKRGLVINTTSIMLVIPVEKFIRFLLNNNSEPNPQKMTLEELQPLLTNLNIILALFILNPLLGTFFDNVIMQNSCEYALNITLPKALSNKKIYDILLSLSQKNIPLISSIAHYPLKKVKDHYTADENSTSFVKETTTDTILATTTLLLKSSNLNPLGKLMAVRESIARSDNYRKSNFPDTIAYKSGFNASIYIMMAAITLFLKQKLM